MGTLSVGLTGGLASGKSTVGRWLGEAGCDVLDADVIVAELYRPGGPGARAVESIFGGRIIDATGAVDKGRLADRVFADGLARRRLEEAVHPLVREQFRRFASSARGIAVLEVPLLVESGMASDFDVIVTVEADHETRVRRAVERGHDEEEARARMAAQASDALRRAAADIVIQNDGSLEDLRNRVDEVLAELVSRVDDG